jgi:subtilase family serine protease
MDMWMPTDGTSASTPVFAGITGLLKAQTGRRLGFLNPMLYMADAAHEDAFHDVTEGSNRCKSACCGKDGFSAQKGWVSFC